MSIRDDGDAIHEGLRLRLIWRAFTFDILFEKFIRGIHIHDGYNEDDEYDAVCSNELKQG